MCCMENLCELGRKVCFYICCYNCIKDPDTCEIDPEIALGIKIYYIHPPPKEYKVDYQNTKGNMPKCTETKRQMHSDLL